jgi:hypothetical protein
LADPLVSVVAFVVMVQLFRTNLLACVYAALSLAAVLGPVHHSVFHVLEPDADGRHHAHHPHHDDGDDADHDGLWTEEDSHGEHEGDCCGFQLARETVKHASQDVSTTASSVAWVCLTLLSDTSADAQTRLVARSPERPPESRGDIARLRTILLLV